MTTTNTIEIQGMQSEIQNLENRKSELNAEFQAAIAEADASKLLSLGKEIQRVESEIETLEKRYAKATGEAVPNQKGIAAKNLKAKVAEIVSGDNLDQIYTLVRDIWSLQSERKLEKIELVFNADDPQPTPIINLVGGFRNVEAGSTKTAAEGRKQREVTRWVVPGEEEPVGRKRLILLYGPKYGQTEMFDKMTPKQREELSDAIAAGEGFAKA